MSAISRVFSNTLSKSAVKSNLSRAKDNDHSQVQKSSRFGQQSFESSPGNLFATTDNRGSNVLESSVANASIKPEK